MSPRKKAPAELDLRLASPPELWQLTFTRKDGGAVAEGEAEESRKGALQFRLGLQRPELERLGVELGLSLDLPAAHVDVAYRVVFELDPGGRTDVDLDERFRIIAAQVAPATLYPFIRETVMTATIKAGLPPMLPPIVNFRHVFRPQDMDVPRAPAEHVRDEAAAEAA